MYDGTITPPDPYSDTYEDDPALYDEDDYGEYPYTFNNYYYGWVARSLAYEDQQGYKWNYARKL